MKQKGFTLAEVLITIGIIGVVSTMTLPALIQNYQDKVYEAGIKKSVNTVSNAVQTYMAMEGISNLKNAGFYRNRTGLVSFVDKYFKVVNNCGTKYNDKNKCFASSYSSQNRSQSGALTDSTDSYVVALSDGMTLCFKLVNSNSSSSSGSSSSSSGGNGFIIGSVPDGALQSRSSNYVMTVDVDTNGVNGPNIAGRDLFTMTVNLNGLVFDPTYNADNDSYNASSWSTSMVAPMPIGRVVANGWKIDY